MQGVWAFLLYRYTAAEDITYGVTVSGRSGELSDMEQRIGLYINTLPLHTHVDPAAPVTQWLQQLQAQQVAARHYQHSRLADIQKWAAISGDWFDSLLVFENYPVSSAMRDGARSLQFTGIQGYEQTNFPLTITIAGKKEVAISFGYNTRLLEGHFIRQIAGHFREVLYQLVERQPERLGDLSPLTRAERQLVLEQFNDTAVGYPRDQTVAGLFMRQAAQTPDHPAILFDDRILSYRQLDQDSNRLAHYLRELGIREEMPVALCLDRSFYMITAILGILKAGGAYVPIDPDYPAQRIAFMLQDSEASVLVTHSHSRYDLPPSYTGRIITLDQDWPDISTRPHTPPVTGLQPHHLAYINYTSVTTGTPNGAMNQHDALVNRLCWARDYFQLSSDDTVLQKTTFCFDVSVWELILPLISGARLLLAAPGGHKDPAYLAAVIDRHRVTCLHFVPSMLEVFLRDVRPHQLLSLRQVICSGEELKPHLASLFSAVVTNATLYNLYGPTEAAIDVSCWPVPRQADPLPVIPIGKPIANVRLFILDSIGQPLPPGIAGELCIGGMQVARGYLNRPELTREKFLPDPFSDRGGDAADQTGGCDWSGQDCGWPGHRSRGARLYRTGDRARWLPDGKIEYLGRIDQQVKIRGFRIEPGEIEAVLLQSGLVRQCVVLARPDTLGNLRLIAYVVSNGTFERERLTAYLRQRLPDYMVPALWTAIDSLPLTANGKLDTKALPDPDASTLLTDSYEPPRNELETTLASLWQDLLGIDRIGIHDNFFTLGGHSLLAMQAVAMIRSTLNLELLIRDIFEYPVISQLSVRLQEQRQDLRLPPLLAEQRPDQLPLSFSQERLWFIDRLEGSIHYHIPWVIRLKGPLDKQALDGAQRHIVNRHELMPTVLGEQDGRSYQLVMPPNRFHLQYLDWQSDARPSQPLRERIMTLIHQPFDLAADHPLRAQLAVIDPQEYILVMVFHHIAFDGRSADIFLQELKTCYANGERGEEPFLPPLPIQYADFAIWQRRWLTGKLLATKLAYWRHQLTGVAPPCPSLPITPALPCKVRAAPTAPCPSTPLSASRFARSVPLFGNYPVHDPAGRIQSPGTPLQQPGRYLYRNARSRQDTPGDRIGDRLFCQYPGPAHQPGRQPLLPITAQHRQKYRPRRLRPPGDPLRKNSTGSHSRKGSQQKPPVPGDVRHEYPRRHPGNKDGWSNHEQRTDHKRPGAIRSDDTDHRETAWPRLWNKLLPRSV